MSRTIAIAAIVAVLALAGCKNDGAPDGTGEEPPAPSGLSQLFGSAT